MGPKKFRNYLDINKHIEGNEERLESLRDILENGTFIPKPVGYKDIDMAFKEWAENTVKMQDEKGLSVYDVITHHSDDIDLINEVSEYKATSGSGEEFYVYIVDSWD